MRRYIFQKDLLKPILALAFNDPEKDIRYNSLRVFNSMSAEGRVRKWANENGVLNTVKKMAADGTLSPEIKSQSKILLENLKIPYENTYSDTDYKTLDITAKYRSPATKTQRPLVKKQQVKTQFPKKQQQPEVSTVHKTSPTPVHKTVSTPVQQKYFTPKISTTPTYKTATFIQKTSPSPTPKTVPVVQKKTVVPVRKTLTTPVQARVHPKVQEAPRCDDASESSSASMTERDIEGSSISDSMSYFSEDESDDIPILSETMQAELLEKQRAAVMQARIEEELARERAEKEARKREEEEKRKAEEEAKERAAEEARRREAEERRKQEAERLHKEAEAEKKRIEEESKRRIEKLMSEAKHAREEELQEQIRREHAEKEAKKKEIEERKRMEEARRAEEEARMRAEAEAAARKKKKAEERAARHEKKRLEKEKKEKEEAAAKRGEEEAKLKALEEEQRKARERDAREKEDARKKHIRRTYIVQEIFDTEKNYVEGLTHMVNAYMQPLAEKCHSRKDTIVTQQQIKLIFSNVEIILNYASTLLELLQNRMEKWDETTCIGDIFLGITPFFASYVDYVNNYPSALETLNKLHSNERFQAFLDRVEKERPDLYLPSVIAFPIQRIPRYILLLADLLKHTDRDHPDYASLEKAVEFMKETGNHINERKRENENSTKMCLIQSTIKGSSIQIFTPGRRFVSEMNIGVVKKMGMAPRIGITYLFSDSVFVARSLPKNKVLFKCLVPYSSLKTEILGDSRNLTNGLKIVNKSPNPKDKHSEWVITFDTPEDRKTWLSSVVENSKEFEKRKPISIPKH